MNPARILAGEIRARCVALGDSPAVHFVSKALGDRTVSWATLLESADTVAREIRSAPLQSGVVVIVLDHSLELLDSLIGSILADRTPTIFSLPSVKLNMPKYFEALPKLLANAQPDLIITSPELYRQLSTWGISLRGIAVMAGGKLVTAGETTGPSQSPSAERPSKAAAILQYSSGTTGLRKGVALDDAAILEQIDGYGRAIRLSADDIIISWLPLYHDMGLIACCLMPLVKGVPVVWMSPFDWVGDPALWFRYAHRFRATLSWLPNFAYNYSALRVTPAMTSGVDLSSLRCIVNCAEPVRADSHRLFAEKFSSLGLQPSSLGTCYALAENTFAVTEGGVSAPVVHEEVDADDLLRRNLARRVPSGRGGYPMLSSGRTFPGQEVKIVDAGRVELPPRRVGEVAIRSACIMRGYYKNEEATAESMDGEGWFYTKDLGYLTEERDLFVTGRMNDMIIVGGVNIYPSDIEYFVSEVPGVHPGRVVTFGVDNEAKGTEDLVVIAELEPSWKGREQEVEAGIRREISMRAECPVADVRLVPPMWLLKSSSGKIARGANRGRYLSERNRH